MTQAAAGAVEALRVAIEALRPEVHLAPQESSAPPAWQRHAAVRGLVALPEAARGVAIRALLGAQDAALRAVGIHVLIEGGHGELIDLALERADESGQVLARTMAIAAIGRLGLHDHLDDVRQALREPGLFWVAIESLVLLGSEPALAALRGAIQATRSDWDRLDIVTILGEVGGPLAVPVLIEVLGDEGEGFAPIQGFAAQALGALGDGRALGPLLDALADERVSEKGRVLWGIGALARAEAFEAVAPWVEAARKDWWRDEALKALAASAPTRAWPRVRAAAVKDPFFRGDAEHFMAVMHALGRIAGTLEAFDLLLDALRVTRGEGLTGAVDWRPPAFVRAGDVYLAGVALRALGAQAGVALLPEQRPDAFSHDALVEQLIARLAEALERQGHPRAAHLRALCA